MNRDLGTPTSLADNASREGFPPAFSSFSNRFVVLAVTVLLGILVLQLALTASRNSITWDEDDHIYAGYMSWKHADFGLNPEHPPLVKQLAAIPLLRLPLKMPQLQDRFFKLEAFLGGKDFLFQNDADGILFRARMSAALLTVLLGLLVFLAGREMFGTGAGLIALTLFVFDPNILAHGAVVGTDVGLSCFMFGAVYAFYRFVRSPSALRLVVVGVATGFALAAKHTGILLFPILFVLAVLELVFPYVKAEADTGDRTRPPILRMAVSLAAIGAISVSILWAFYGFRYQARANELQLNPPFTEFVKGMSRPREVHLLETVARYHLLPESYLYGLADVRIMSDFYTSYLFGKIYPHGVWFYFPAAFAIKSTLSFLVFLGIAIWAISACRLRRWREILVLTLPPAIHLAVAMSAGMNIGLRHILPMYPFLYVLIAGACWQLIFRQRSWLWVVAALTVFQIFSGMRTFPAYMAYANELWGGPSQTYWYLSDSNADWGQQLKATKKYLDQHGIKDCWFVYFAEGVVDTHYYGIPCKPLPTADSLWVNEQIDAPPVVDGTILISAGDLSGFEFGAAPLNPYEQFKNRQPIDVIDYGVFVFQGHFEIPLAASISHAQKAQALLHESRLDEALIEAQEAIRLAPNAVRPRAIAGDIFVAMQRPDQARTSYQRALALAQTVAPEFQRGWADSLSKKLEELSSTGN